MNLVQISTHKLIISSQILHVLFIVVSRYFFYAAGNVRDCIFFILLINLVRSSDHCDILAIFHGRGMLKEDVKRESSMSWCLISGVHAFLLKLS